MKTSKLLLLASLLCLASLPALAQVNDTYVIPVAANARGAFGTHWMTRFSIFNPHLKYDLTVSMTFLPTGGATGDEVLIEIPANGLFYSSNILQEAYGVSSGSGALVLAAFAEDNPGVPDDVLSLSFLVTSDTFNNHPNGTYGQTIPGVWAGLLDYRIDPITSVAHGIRNAGAWRTNIGAVNLGSCTATLLVSLYDANGNTIMNDAPFSLPPYGHMQDRLPVAVNNGSVEFTVSDPCREDDDRFAVVFPYTSTIDERTGDATYQNPTLLAEPNVLFAKGQKIDPHSLGKKIDAAYVKNIRAHANRLGSLKLTQQENGWQIAK